jgi:hypothetical protein
VTLAIILAGYLLVLIDVPILMAALPSIRADLGFNDTSLSWAQNAYTLTFGGLLLAHRVSAALTAAVAFLALALLVTLAARPRRAAATSKAEDRPLAPDRTAAEADTLVCSAA